MSKFLDSSSIDALVAINVSVSRRDRRGAEITENIE